jgi:uncharacterized protein YoxC
MNTLKTMGIALFVAAVTAVSVVWYIDYKINQVTEAVMSPVYATTEKVTQTIDVVEDHVTTATDLVDGVVEDANVEISDKYDQARADVLFEWENAKSLASDANAWLGSLRS